MNKSTGVKIAVIVEDQRLQDYIVLLLVGEGYEVKAFSSQNEALSTLDKEVIDFIISDFQSPHINGLDICKVLRKNYLYNHIPIFFLIPDTEPLNAARLIYAGADDYIKKSQIEDELFLKVKLNLYRSARQQDINAVTRLPGQAGLLREIQKRIEFKELFCVSCASLICLKEFHFHYGFERGAAVIKYTGALIQRILKELGDTADFLAHTHNEDFIFITYPEKIDAIASKIIREFDQGIMNFYTEEDKKNGYFVLTNRFGETRQVGLIALRIGMVHTSYFPLFTPSRIIQIVSEIKDISLKETGKSSFIKEERKNYSIT